MSVDSLPLAFAQIVKQYPDYLAIQHGDVVFTYQEVWDRSHQLACGLARCCKIDLHGEPLGLHIGLCLERGPEMVFGLLAILQLGCLYVPLDPQYPEKRLLQLVQDAHLTAVVTSSRLRSIIGFPDNICFFCVDQKVETSHQAMAINIRDCDACYMIYTSGTTGRPKGVVCQHGGVLNMIRWAIQRYPVTAADKVLQLASISFDLSVWEIFIALLSGATLVMVPYPDYKDPKYIAACLRHCQITILGATPTMYRCLLRQTIGKQMDGLRVVLVCAEPFDMFLCHALAAMGNFSLYNGYGSTEASIMSMHWKYCQGYPGKKVVLGEAIANTEVVVLDGDQKPVALGEVGELYISGVGLAQGYHGQEKTTNERFVWLDLSGSATQRYFRTGDFVCKTKCGELVFVGRHDCQAKRYGIRVDLSEIEANIEALLPGATCMVTYDNTDQKDMFVAYVSVAEQDAVAVQPVELRALLATRLPSHLLPNYFILINKVPLTTNGKLDYGELPQPKSSDRFSGQWVLSQCLEETIDG